MDTNKSPSVKNLTTGSVGQKLLFFTLPYLLSYFLQTLYGMADLFIVGQFNGVAETTAVSIGSQVMHMLTVMIVGLAMGTTVSIAQAGGAGHRKHRAAFYGSFCHAACSSSAACPPHCCRHVDAGGSSRRHRRCLAGWRGFTASMRSVRVA